MQHHQRLPSPLAMPAPLADTTVAVPVFHYRSAPHLRHLHPGQTSTVCAPGLTTRCQRHRSHYHREAPYSQTQNLPPSDDSISRALHKFNSNRTRCKTINHCRHRRRGCATRRQRHNSLTIHRCQAPAVDSMLKENCFTLGKIHQRHRRRTHCHRAALYSQPQNLLPLDTSVECSIYKFNSSGGCNITNTCHHSRRGCTSRCQRRSRTFRR